MFYSSGRVESVTGAVLILTRPLTQVMDLPGRYTLHSLVGPRIDKWGPWSPFVNWHANSTDAATFTGITSGPSILSVKKQSAQLHGHKNGKSLLKQ